MPAYNRAKKQDGSFDWDDVGQTFRVLLTTSSYTPNVDHDFVSDVTNEIAGGGYVRKDVAGRAVVLDDANDRADHDADNLTWTALTNAFRYAVLYRFVTNDADSVLLYYWDLGAQSVTASDFTIAWNAGASSGTVFRGT
jgi:hypothetical protein